jgi:hypothetical protein
VFAKKIRFQGLFLCFWALIRLSLQVLGAAGTAAAHCGGSQGRLLVAAAVACPACGLSVPSGARASRCLIFLRKWYLPKGIVRPAAGIEAASTQGCRSLAREVRRRRQEPTQTRWAGLPATAD